MALTTCGFNDAPGSSGCDMLVAIGPTLFVQIGFDPTFDPLAIPIGSPNLPTNLLHALVDSGATESCIDSTIATALNLPIIDRRSVSGVHGAGEVNMHLAHIHIPALN